MHKSLTVLLLSLVLVACGGDKEFSEERKASTNTVTVTLASLESGEQIGTVRFKDSPDGVFITPNLTGLTPGEHGFHVHENYSCDTSIDSDGNTVLGGGAGGHYDPKKTGHHHGPDGEGHLGDLPLLIVGDEGQAVIPLVASRLSVSDIIGRSLIVHAGGDNFSDDPVSLGGGGARVACGLINQ